MKFFQAFKKKNPQPQNVSLDLHWAVRKNDIYIVQLLIQNGADVNFQKHYGVTPLHSACFHGYKDIVKLLLDNGANINAKDNGGDTPLHCAAQRFHTELVQYLVKKGANVGILNKDRFTPLEYRPDRLPPHQNVKWLG